MENIADTMLSYCYFGLPVTITASFCGSLLLNAVGGVVPAPQMEMSIFLSKSNDSSLWTEMYVLCYTAESMNKQDTELGISTGRLFAFSGAIYKNTV